MSKNGDDGWKEYGPDDVMQTSSNADETVVLYSDASINYVCNSGTTWTVLKLNTSLSGRSTSAAGCYVEYTFTGDRVQVFGAQSTSTGVYGCIVDDNPLFTGWWDASSSANIMVPYKGMCDIAGIGYGKHTVKFANSPYKARDAIFTGLRFATNKTAQPWSNPSIAGAGAPYTFPSGVSSAIDATLSQASGSSKGIMDGTNWDFVFFAVVAVVALAALAGIVLGSVHRPLCPFSGQARPGQSFD